MKIALKEIMKPEFSVFQVSCSTRNYIVSRQEALGLVSGARILYDESIFGEEYVQIMFIIGGNLTCQITCSKSEGDIA